MRDWVKTFVYIATAIAAIGVMALLAELRGCL
jgi:hypothetical protein